MAVAIVTATVVSAQKDDSDSKITVSIHQTDQEDGYGAYQHHHNLYLH